MQIINKLTKNSFIFFFLKEKLREREREINRIHGERAGNEEESGAEKNKCDANQTGRSLRSSALGFLEQPISVAPWPPPSSELLIKRERERALLSLFCSAPQRLFTAVPVPVFRI